MDLQGLGAFLSAIGGYFSAKAGATAGKLQGLLTGEDLTERRKRMQMTEEAHQLQTELLRKQEERTSELFPLQKGMLQQEFEQRGQLFPLQKEALGTQVELGKLNLEDTRLWSLFRQGVAPSQISDPVLRQRYEPFFNYQMGVRSLEAVQTREELDAVLAQVPEEFRPSLEIMGRMQLFTNQSKRQMVELQMRGVETNIAQGEFSLRTAKLNHALTTILNNINNEGMDWDKRSPQQKIEAVKKWLEQTGLSDIVPEDFANMFQRVKSVDARQFALYRAQADLQHRYNMEAMSRQFGYNLSLQDRAFWGNIVAGALGLGGGQGGVGGGNVAPVGFPALPPIPSIFNNTYDNRGSNLNPTALSKYLNSAPFEISVPFGRGYQPLSVIGAHANAIYQKLGRPNATISAEEINTLITFDAGLLQSHFAKNGMEIDWNSALAWATERVLPTIQANPAYTANMNYQRVVNDWRRKWEQRLQQGAGGGGQTSAPAPQQGAQGQGGQRRPPNPPTGAIPRDRLDRQP